jgi:hypothetical protein
MRETAKAIEAAADGPTIERPGGAAVSPAAGGSVDRREDRLPHRFRLCLDGAE